MERRITVWGLAAIGIAIAATSCQFVQEPERSPTDAEYYRNPVVYDTGTAVVPRAAEYEDFFNGLPSPSESLPGCAALVMDGGGTFCKAIGQVDMLYGVSWETNTRSKIGSITKSFVSVVCLKLAEEGRLDLDRAASDYLDPALVARIANSDTATVRQLLNHTSGIYNWTENGEWTGIVYDGPEPVVKSRADALAFAYDMQPYFSPGGGFHYSNTNYLLAGLIIESVLGVPVSLAIETYVIEPLDLRSTFLPTDYPVPAGIPRGYADVNGIGPIYDITHVEIASCTEDGGMVSTVQDLAAFIRAVAFDRDFLSAESFAEMTTQGHADSTVMSKYNPALDDYEGLGISVMEYNGKTWLANSGGNLGYTSYVATCLETGQTFALLVNGANNRIGTMVLQNILIAALEKFT